MTTHTRILHRFGVAAAILAAVATSLTAASPPGFSGPQRPADHRYVLWNDSERAEVARRPGFGFHVLFSATGNGPSLGDFKKDIDIVVASGQKWVRFGIVGWEVMGVWGERQIHWNEKALKKYDAAINYAYSKGLSIDLITADADNNPQTSFSDYVKTLRQYWRTLAMRYAKKIAVWQVYSESDTSHFRFLTLPIHILSLPYLEQLAFMLKVAREEVRAANPNVLVTTTGTGWPMNDATQEKWHRYFDQISQSLDAISLDMYPADNSTEIQSLPSRIKDIRRRYRKPVIIAEVGLQVAGKWSAEDQRLFVPAAIAAAKKAMPLAIIVYQLRDGRDSSFGLLKQNRQRRPSFPAAIGVMRY
jgi:Glycosyl hydrolase family 53